MAKNTPAGTPPTLIMAKNTPAGTPPTRIMPETSLAGTPLTWIMPKKTQPSGDDALFQRKIIPSYRYDALFQARDTQSGVIHPGRRALRLRSVTAALSVVPVAFI